MRVRGTGTPIREEISAIRASSPGSSRSGSGFFKPASRGAFSIFKDMLEARQEASEGAPGHSSKPMARKRRAASDGALPRSERRAEVQASRPTLPPPSRIWVHPSASVRHRNTGNGQKSKASSSILQTVSAPVQRREFRAGGARYGPTRTHLARSFVATQGLPSFPCATLTRCYPRL